MSTLAVEATGLAKSYGDTRAVDGVDLAVPAGSVYGFLGPNGAGKTTTIRMLATLVHPDGGSARVLGRDVVAEADAVRSLVSLTGQLASVDEELTGAENLVLLGKLLGFRRAAARARADELLEAFGVADAAGRLVKHWSGGMRRRLDIAASLVVTPQLLFLDEPTTGLDPRSRNQVWEIVRALSQEGTTVLLCTQYLEEADQLAERVAIIDHGKIVEQGSPEELKAQVGDPTLYAGVVEDAIPDAEDVLARFGASVPAKPGMLGVRLRGGAAAMADVVRALDEAGVVADHMELHQPSLDDVFARATGRRLEGAADDAASAPAEPGKRRGR
jgi:ABC-2 type transport system ATP-binding protein